MPGGAIGCAAGMDGTGPHVLCGSSCPVPMRSSEVAAHRLARYAERLSALSITAALTGAVVTAVLGSLRGLYHDEGLLVAGAALYTAVRTGQAVRAWRQQRQARLEAHWFRQPVSVRAYLLHTPASHLWQASRVLALTRAHADQAPIGHLRQEAARARTEHLALHHTRALRPPRLRLNLLLVLPLTVAWLNLTPSPVVLRFVLVLCALLYALEALDLLLLDRAGDTYERFIDTLVENLPPPEPAPLAAYRHRLLYAA